MHTDKLAISYGQAYLAQDRNSARSAMTVCYPRDPVLDIKGAAAVIADSTWRNALAKQAGETCVRGFIADYYATPDHWDLKEAVTRVLRSLNGWLYSQSRTLVKGSYISSFSALVMHQRQAHLFHMGDTLVYRLRAGDLEPLTRQHTTSLGGYRYPSRALGMDQSIDIDYLNFQLRPGDLFLFTTQSVHAALLPSELMPLIHAHPDHLDRACDALLQQAVSNASRRGHSSYNFCFQLVRVDAVPHTAAPVAEQPATVAAESISHSLVFWRWLAVALLLLLGLSFWL